MTVEGEIFDSPETLVAAWSKLWHHQYHLHLENKRVKELKSVAYAIPLGLVILGLFLLQRSGLMNLVSLKNYLRGQLFDRSDCLAYNLPCGGGRLVLLFRKISQEVSTTRLLVLFHTGRIIGFTILGGILGAVGK